MFDRRDVDSGHRGERRERRPQSAPDRVVEGSRRSGGQDHRHLQV